MMSSQRVTSTTHGKAPAPPPPTDHPHSAAGISASESQLNRNPGQEIWLNEQITGEWVVPVCVSTCIGVQVQVQVE